MKLTKNFRLFINLQQKHTVATVPQLLEIQTVLEEKIEITNNLDGED